MQKNLMSTLIGYKSGMPVALTAQLVVGALNACVQVAELRSIQIPCSRLCSRISGEPCLRVLVAVNIGMFHSSTECIMLHIILLWC